MGNGTSSKKKMIPVNSKEKVHGQIRAAVFGLAIVLLAINGSAYTLTMEQLQAPIVPQ